MCSGIFPSKSTHRLQPSNDVFQAQVKIGSTCIPEPDLSGPISNLNDNVFTTWKQACHQDRVVPADFLWKFMQLRSVQLFVEFVCC